MLYDCRLYFVGNSNIIIINRPTAAHGPPRMRRNYMSDAAKRMLNEAAEFENLAKYLKVFFEVRQSCRQCSAKLSRNKIHVLVGLRLLLILMSFSVKSVKMNISSIKGPSIDDVHTEGGGCQVQVDACRWGRGSSSMWTSTQKIKIRVH